MKKILNTLLFVILTVPIFGQHQYQLYYQSETEEYIQLSVCVYGVKEKYANQCACLYAVKDIVFEGINGSKRRCLPYVFDKKSSFEEHAAYYHDLFDKGGFYSYIIASSIVEKGKTQQKKKFFVVNVNVNFKALKESLTSHNVIRKFGV